MENHTSWIRREPVGVIGQVSPWNYPMMMAIWKFCPAIAAGNTVVIKPSDTTPVTTVMLAEMAAKHFPPGVLNVVCGDRNTGAAVVAHPDAGDGVDHRFGGRGPRGRGQRGRTSEAHAPRARRQGAGDRVRRQRHRRAAEGIATAGYFNAGQDCTAATRVLAHASRWPSDLTDALAEQAAGATTTFGKAADDEDAWVPPVNNVNQMERVLASSTDVPSHAKVAAGGQRQGDKGFYVEPTVIGGLRQDDRLVQTGDLRTGDHGAVVLRRGRGDRMGQRHRVRPGVIGVDARTCRGRCGCPAALDFGCVWINTHIPLVAEMPHGGFKSSGHGKDLSMYGLEDYTRIKHVMAYTG